MSSTKDSSSPSIKNLDVVNLDYADLVQNKDLSSLIQQAFGSDGYGILTVSNVPRVAELRKIVLPLSFQFANLPDSIKNLYVDEKSNYSFGWSHGKETFNGKLDFAKGSFYANPTMDVSTNDQLLKEKAPFFCRDNIWPTEHLPQLEKAFKDMSRLLVDVGLLVSRQCDAFAQKTFKNYKAGTLHHTIADSKCHKARLLYYFPLEDDTPKQKSDDVDSWCGWHSDTDTLTGLLKGMYFDKDGKCLDGTFKDPEAGLFIRDRKGEIRKGVWNTDQIAFQIGECSQIVTGGELRATPHCVRGSDQTGIGRAQMACFMQPTWDVVLSPPEGVDVSMCEAPGVTKPLSFMEYANMRFSQYYAEDEKEQ
mmetsp:Transcript_3834/g.14531  ORF Transcript_3834/g.14531 Transcript_3834/m.14531 type:complete len:364 (-) Transcript_3834:166-1257(-)